MAKHDRHSLRWCHTAFAFVMFATTGAVASSEEALGKVFFTPQQRAEMDRRRVSNIRIPDDKAQIPAGNVSLSGVMRRSDGKTTTWLNGNPENDTLPAADIRSNADRVRISSPEGESIRLRVGESLNRATGEPVDGLKGGKIRLAPDAKSGAGSTLTR